MAPEQSGGEAVDARCDLWSLGVVLYYMGTGQFRFKGVNTVATLKAIAMNDPPPPAKINPQVPAALSELVMKLLEKDPAKRIASAQEVVDALRDLEKGDQATHVIASRQVKVPPTKTKRQIAPITNAAQGSTGAAAATKKSRKPLFVGICGAVVATVVFAIVLFWQTPHGLVRIESDDPNVEIVFDKTGPKIKGADKEPIKLQAGEHAVLIKRGDFAFEADKFMLRKGETITLKLELLKGKMQFVQDGKVIGAKDFPAQAKAVDPVVGPLPPKFTNTLGMEFALVPKGIAWLGGGSGKDGPAFKEWSTKAVRDAFFASPQFPIQLFRDCEFLRVPERFFGGFLGTNT